MVRTTRVRGFPAYAVTDDGRVYTMHGKVARPITLRELRQHPALDGLLLLKRGNRLSVMPVDETHWHYILTLE